MVSSLFKALNVSSLLSNLPMTVYIVLVAVVVVALAVVLYLMVRNKISVTKGSLPDIDIAKLEEDIEAQRDVALPSIELSDFEPAKVDSFTPPSLSFEVEPHIKESTEPVSLSEPASEGSSSEVAAPKRKNPFDF